MDNVENKSDKLLFIITAVVCATVLVFTIFSFTINYFMNKSSNPYEYSIAKYVKDINSTNLSVISLVKGQTIDTKASIKVLPNKINKLVKDKDALEKLQPLDSYKKIHEDLIIGLDNNINIYKQINAIFLNPQSTDLENSSANVEKYKNDCTNYYSLTVLKTTHILLPAKCLTFIDNSIVYTNNLAGSKKSIEIKNSQNADFDQNVDTIISTFQPLMIDFNVYAIKARNGIGTYDDIISMIDNTKLNFNNVTNDFSQLTVPPSAVPIYNALDSTFKTYILYLNNFRNALSNEKSKNNVLPLDENAINSLYAIPLKNFKDLYINYNIFDNLYYNFKTK